MVAARKRATAEDAHIIVAAEDVAMVDDPTTTNAENVEVVVAVVT